MVNSHPRVCLNSEWNSLKLAKISAMEAVEIQGYLEILEISE